MDTNVKVVQMSKDQVPDLAEIHMMAFKGYSNTRIGTGYVKKFLEWFIDYKNGIALTALYNERVVGYVVGAPVGYQKKMNKNLLATAFFGFLSHPWALFNKKILSIVLSRIKVLLSSQNISVTNDFNDSDTLSLVGIAVSPDFKGLNIGHSLMKKFEEKAVAANFNAMKLSVYDNNISALKLYTRSGWKEHFHSKGTVTFVKKLIK